MTFSLPADTAVRPITVIGGGTLGRRVALMLSLRGADVRIFDLNPAVGQAAVDFIEAERPAVAAEHGGAAAGRITAGDDLAAAVDNAWLVVEAVPEKLELKRGIFADLDRLAPADALLASNSSSFASSEFIGGVSTPERVLNMHFYMPPAVRSVELMSCGRTDPAVLDLLMAELSGYALAPHLVRKESTGFIFNRVWAAIKREALLVVAEGVAEPEDVDALFVDVFKADTAPFRFMDQVGLDVVLDIENHYCELAGMENKSAPLLQEYIGKGWLGIKSGRGFYNDYA